MRRNLGKAIAFVLAAAACGPTPRSHDDTPDGGGGGSNDNGGSDDNPNPNSQGCSDEAKLIYVVDQNRTFSQFDPKTKTFNDLGELSCLTSPSNAEPFSMAVARDAAAWVLYDNGELFHVDTKNNLTCTKSAWVPNTLGEKKFGMGFSTDQVGGTADTLFISGGTDPSDSPTSKLAKLDMTSFQPTPIATVTGWPELTGTGNAELWGFFPARPGYTMARVLQVNKTNGSVSKTLLLSDLNGASADWAFAFHGGSFWVFLRRDFEDWTRTYQIDSMTGAIVYDKEATDRQIVGAGVSTCAPVIIL